MMTLKLALVGGMLIAGSAMAADATFENHLTATPMVSPAQIYQIEDLRTDFNLGITSTEGTSKPDGGDETTSTASGTDIFAAGIYNIKAIGLRAGLTVNYGTTASTDDVLDTTDPTNPTTTEVKTDTTDFVASPTAAYPIGPVVIGAALDVVQRSEKPEEGDEAKVSFTRFRPGALFQNKDLEAGLAYISGNRKTNEGDAEKLAVYEPNIVTAHGRFAINKDVAAGAIIQNVNYKAIEDDLYKDQTRVKATGEFGVGALKVEGDLGYNTAFYKGKTAAEGFGEGSISTMELGAAADYRLNKDAAVGGGLGYEFGSDSGDGMKVAANEVKFAVRGNMSF